MPKRERGSEARRAQFIDAAGSLFLSRGYNGTSVRDILDAMGDGVNSPSVFYYYFKSKDDIYQAVLQRRTEQYLSEIERSVQDEGRDPLEMLADVLRAFLGAMRSRASFGGEAGDSLNNRMFHAYLLSEIVKKGTEVWERIIFALPWEKRTRAESRRLAAFINGGIGALTRGDCGDATTLTERIIDFCADVLHAPEVARERFKQMLRSM